MKTEIFPLSLGFDNCYIIREQGMIMIDGGSPKKKDDFTKAIKKIPIEPKDIGLLVMTDGHPEHIGSAKDIADLTNAKIAMHRLAKDCLEKGAWKEMHVPGGNIGNKVLVAIISWFYGEIPSTRVGLVVEDHDFPLSEYGISGRIVYTPGHTLGSVSVLLDSGDVFVGDLAMNKFPFRFGPGLPPIAEDKEKVKESWRRLIELGAATVYPAKGKPFSAEVIRKALK